jgi:hypothetical protein
MMAGTCSRAGTVGIFGYVGGTWHQAAPSLPASLAGQHVRSCGWPGPVRAM